MCGESECIPANFPDSGGIFPISSLYPAFPIGISKNPYFPDFEKFASEFPPLSYFDNQEKGNNSIFLQSANQMTGIGKLVMMAADPGNRGSVIGSKIG
jgi:hypothetical protein